MKTITPAKAIARGHFRVTLPVLAVIVLGGLVGRYFFGGRALLLGLIVGAALAWPCWSFLIPRWRDWVEEEGLDPDEIQSLAVRAGLVWRKGSLFERTEFRRRNGKRGA